MKITFIYLGILVTMFSNSIFAYDLTNKQNYQEINSSEMSFVSLSNSTTSISFRIGYYYNNDCKRYKNNGISNCRG